MKMAAKDLIAKIQTSMEVLIDDGDDLEKLALAGDDLAKLANLIGINATYQGDSQFEVIDETIETEDLEIKLTLTLKTSSTGKFIDRLETLLGEFAIPTHKYRLGITIPDPDSMLKDKTLIALPLYNINTGKF